jgi:hypothetical protein
VTQGVHRGRKLSCRGSDRHRLAVRTRVPARSAVAVAVICGLVLAAAASTAAAQTYIASGQDPATFLIKPATFVAGSGVAGGVMWYKQVRWDRWGSRSASGHGLLTFRTCKPDCLSGGHRTERVKIVLSAPRKHCKIWTDGDEHFYRSPLALFTKITATFPNGNNWPSNTAETQSCQ